MFLYCTGEILYILPPETNTVTEKNTAWYHNGMGEKLKQVGAPQQCS